MVTVVSVLVADLRHFLDMPDDAPGPARRLAVQLGAIVRAATARPVGTGGLVGGGMYSPSGAQRVRGVRHGVPPRQRRDLVVL